MRKTEPHRLSRLVRGELDWIVMKSLEKDRTRRYATAQGFAGDVQRFLDDEPVLACPPSAVYRLTKFMRRHKGVLATLAALVLLLITATVGAVLAAVQSDEIAQQARQLAAAAEERAEVETRAREELDRRLYANRIALAQQELYAQNSGRAQELLDECPPALRGWEWNFLKRFRPGNPVTVTGNMRGATFTPDGRSLGLSDPSRPILVDPETGTIVRTFPQLTTTADFYGLAFCKAGEETVLAAGDSGGGQVKLWDVATGEELRTLGGLGQRLRTVVFSPDGRQLAAGCINGGAKIWDWHQGRVLFEFPDWSISRLVYSPNGAHLACSVFGQDEDVRICDASTGALLTAFSAQHDNGIEALDYSPDSLKLATSGNDGTLKVWEAATGRLLLILRGHFGPVRDVVYSPDGRRLASAGWDKTVKIWDAENGHELLTLRGHTEMVMKVTFDSAGDRLVSTGADQLVIWNALPEDERVGEAPLRLPGHTGAVRQVEYSRDGRYLVTAGTDRRIQLWDAADLRRGVTAPFETRVDDSTTDLTVTFHPDSRRFVSAGTKGWLRMWELSERLPGWSLRLMDQQTGRTVRDLEFSPDGKRLATIGPGGVTIRDGTNGERLKSLQIPSGNLFALAHHPEGRQIAVCHHFSIMVIDDDTLATVRSLSHPSLVSSVAYTADGRWLAAACFDHCAYLWDSQSGKMLRRLIGHSDRVMTVAFSPNDDLLASGSGDGTVKIWNASTGEELITLRGHTGYVSSLAFSPNGRQLTSTGGHDGKGEVSVWDLAERLPAANDSAALVQTLKNEASFHRLASIAQPKIWQHYQRLARASAGLDQWDGAIDAYAAAVALHPSLLPELTESLRERQRVAEAERLIDRLLVVSQHPQANAPRDAKLQEALARHLSTRGWKELGAGRPQRAEKEFSRAIACYNRLVADFPEHRRNLLALANCHNDLATTLKALGRLDAAEAGYRRALSLKTQLLAETPDDRNCRFHQAHSYLGLGYLQRDQGQPGDAAESFQQAVQLFGGLASQFPKNYGDRRALGSALGYLCDALLQAGRQDEAEAASRRQVATFDALARDVPAQPDDRRKACSSHSRLGRLLRDQGRHADAEQSFRTALEIACSLGRDHPTNVDDRARSRECLRDLIETLKSLGRDTEAEEVRARYQLEFPEP